MTREQLQDKINRAGTPQDMLEIAGSYLDGTVIQDKTAAQAWLMRVLDAGECMEAVKAMEILAKEIWKIEKVLTDKDYFQICQELKSAAGDRKEYLEALEKLGTKEQRAGMANKHINMTNKRCNNNADFVY